MHFTHDWGWESVVLTIELVSSCSDGGDVFVVVAGHAANESMAKAKWSEKLQNWNEP